jgi:hypothetical protein
MLLREPLVHFCLIALTLFVAHAVITRGQSAGERTIRVTVADRARLASLYAVEAGRPATPEELDAVIADYVRDEVLAREARRLGLEENDTVISRRLAQKMNFLIADMAERKTPSEPELKAYAEKHKDKFTAPQRLTFSHVFLSRDTRGDRAASDAEALKARLNAPGAAPELWQSLGDPFMLQRDYTDVPPREVARVFGPDFARAIVQIPAGTAWAGPVESGLGLHLIRMQTNNPPAPLPFEDARDDILRAYQDDAQRAANEKAIAGLTKRYRIEIESAPQ